MHNFREKSDIVSLRYVYMSDFQVITFLDTISKSVTKVSLHILQGITHPHAEEPVVNDIAIVGTIDVFFVQKVLEGTLYTAC